MNDLLKIQTFGGLSLQRGATRVEPGSRKAQALLVYLAYLGKPQPREALAELFWSERPQRQSFGNLRKALFDLSCQVADCLNVTRRDICLKPGSYWLDAHDLQSGLARAAQQWLTDGRLRAGTLDQLETWLALYQGDFLAGFYIAHATGFEEWLRLTQARLQQEVVEGLACLVSSYLEQGAYAAGLRSVDRLLDLDPWREEAHRQKMRLLAYLGRRSQVLAQYDLCQRQLREELGIEPAPETHELLEQLGAGALPGPASSSTPVLHLPVHTTSFLGRETELEMIAQRLNNPECRVLTLTGLGGVGKTRLAARAAEILAPRFTHGVCFVPLASVSASEFVALTVAETLGLSFYGAADPKDHLLNYVRHKELLLVLDNFEHLLDSLPLVSEILDAASGVKVLVTSRERLKLQEEWVLDIQGLPFPDERTPEPVHGFSAVQLFVQRASQIQAGFSLDEHASEVSALCRLVEGMPLALELAATWLRSMACPEIIRQIRTNLDFLSSVLRNVPERHRSIRAVFEHSWSLLTPVERTVLMKLAVFRGGFNLEAAHVIAEASALLMSELVDKSLVYLARPERYGLHELLRQFLLDKLSESGQLAFVGNCHLDYFMHLAEQIEPGLEGPQQLEWLSRAEAEADNFRAALTWSYADVSRIEAGLRLVGALYWFWQLGHVSEGRSWADEGIARAGQVGRNRILGRILYTAGSMTFQQGDYALSQKLATESVSIIREIDDKEELLRVLFGLGSCFFLQGEVDAAYPFYSESAELGRQVGKDWLLSVPLAGLGTLNIMRGNADAARAYFEESWQCAQASGNPWVMGHSLCLYGGMELQQGSYASACARLEQAVALLKKSSDKSMEAIALHRLGEGALYQADYQRAAGIYHELLGLGKALGNPLLTAAARHDLGQVALAGGDDDQALKCFKDSLTLYQQLGIQAGIAMCLTSLALLEQRHGHLTRAAQLFGAAELVRAPNAAYLFLVRHIDATHSIATTRAQLGEEPFAAAWRAGQSMSLEQAIADALSGYLVQDRTR